MTKVKLQDLKSSAKPRPLVTEAIDQLAASIKNIGLLQPIIVRQTDDGPQIIAGHHRVAACRALGWSEIDAIVIDDVESLRAELIEIDENLCRAELTAAQRAAAIKRRKELWDALFPDGKFEVETAFPPQTGVRGGARQQRHGFASDTAAVAGMTKQSLNQHIARANALGDDLQSVVGTSLDRATELDALAKLPEPERKALIERAQAGEKVSAKQAKPDHKEPPAKSPEQERIEELEVQLAELASNLESAVEDIASMSRVLDSNDQLTASLAEAKRYRELARVLQERVNGLMNEKNTAMAAAKHWMRKFQTLEKKINSSKVAKL